MDGASCLNLNIRNTLGMLCWLLSCWSTPKGVARTWSEWAVVSLYHSNWIPAEFSVGKIEQIDACRPKEFLFPLLVTMLFYVVWVKLVFFVSVHISCSAAGNRIMRLYHRLKNSGFTGKYQFLWVCTRMCRCRYFTARASICLSFHYLGSWGFHAFQTSR